MTASSSQSGNMLVYILGAIFLMGLLIVLVKGTSNPGGGIDAEAVIIRATEVQRFAGEVEHGITLIMRNGESEADIRFSHPNAYSAYGTVLTAPMTRQMFHAAGGAVEYRIPPAGVNDGTQWQFFGNTHITDMGNDDTGTRKAELILVLPNVTEDFCNRINEINDQALDIITDTQDPAGGGCIYAPGSEFNGTFVTGNGANVPDSSFFTHNPAAEACVKCASGLHYYHVLLAR